MTQATQARSFSTLYNLCATICQDVSTNGLTNAKTGINTIIKELSRQFKFPEQLVGYDFSQYVQPSASTGIQTFTVNSNISRIENVFWISNNSEQFTLRQITDTEEWLSLTDNNSSGDPFCFRALLPDYNGNNVIQTWPAVSSGWVSYSGGKLYYTFWQQLSQLSNDSDIPALPYELDTVLVNGGVAEVARMQGDTVLLNAYYSKYLDDLGEIRAWLLKQRRSDYQIKPENPMGMFGKDNQVTGYKTG